MAVLDINISEPFLNGDFNITVCDYQNIQAIILAQKGQFYQWPTIGADIRQRFNSPAEMQHIKALISNELDKDKYILTQYEADYTSDLIKIYLDGVKTDL